MTHEEYLKRRDELLKIRSESFDSFDKTVLSLATGSLALSITFLDKIGNPFDKLTYFLILAMWIGLIFAVLSNLLSYIFAKWNMDKKIEELDKNYGKNVAERTFWQRKATNYCNNISVIVFFLSIFSFTWYIIEIQKQNYAKVAEKQKQEELIMVFKKTAGKTEAVAPVTKPISSVRLNDGLTEIPVAISQQTIPKIRTTPQAQPSIKGQTETPQAVQKPKPSTVPEKK